MSLKLVRTEDTRIIRGYDYALPNDRDVQRLTFEGYMYKKLVRQDPMAHARIFFKNLGHLSGLVPV